MVYYYNCIYLFFQEDDLEFMVHRSARIVDVYFHYFDLTILNDDLVKAGNELGAACEEMKTEPQWVPVSWVR